jgi:hypothetical protein
MNPTPLIWHRVYSFADDASRVEAMQRGSLSDDPTIGLAPDPLVGSGPWWHDVRSGEQATTVIDGTISRVYWASMADYPEFAVLIPDGTETSWTREGDVRRYVPDLAVRIAFTEQPWKTTARAADGPYRVVLQIDIEASDLRSSAIGPGPGGAFYANARRRGEACHYFAFDDYGAAERAADALPSGDPPATERPRIWGGPACGGWFFTVWRPNAGAVSEDYAQLQPTVVATGGRYDGGEVVGGACWGPSGPPSTATGD